MKMIQLLVTLTILVSVSSTSVARSKVVKQSQSVKNTVTNKFGLSGTINRYSPKQSIIRIDGINYILKGKGLLTNADLKSNLKIKFNLEKSSIEAMGRITRIWVEEK